MNTYTWAGQFAAPLIVVAGLLTCFWGYRILKITLGLLGFIAGASGGWTLGMSLAPNNSVIVLVCAVLGGLIGAGLCVWVFFLGIFLLGASAGAVVAVAFFNATGHQPQPLLVLGLAVAFGLVALVLQKFMIILSTAFTGSYLITAGILHLFNGAQKAAPLWFEHAQLRSASVLDYVALALWLLLGLAGVSVQYRGRRKGAEEVHKAGAA